MEKSRTALRRGAASSWLGCGASLLTLTMCLAAAPAMAQQAAQSRASEESVVDAVVVTGSRIARTGYTTPTPVTSLSTEELTRTSPSTASEALRTLPALTNTSGTQRNSGSTGGGQSFLDLRGLGATRTLTLLDGRRFVATNVTGSVDANLIPSALLERVEIVTGGASAAYGSDAVSGVVNFILNKKFEGFKGNLQYGQTSHGDNKEKVVNLAAGHAFAGGRGHAIGSFEYYNNKGIPAASRGWAREGWQIINIPGAAGTEASPTQNIASNVRLVSSYGGLILGGVGGTAAANASFRGITFNPDGSPRAFDFGTLTSTGTQVGGDGIDNAAIQQLNRPLDRKTLFAHVNYDVTDSFRVFAEGNYGAVHTDYTNGPNVHNSASAQTAYITIQRDNAFLPTSVRNQMIASGVNALTMTRWDLEDGKTHTDNQNYTTRFVTGFDGKIFGWTTTGYVEWGQNRNKNIVKSTNNIFNFALAVDSVINPATGQAVCRSTLTNPGNGCVAFNPFGVGAPSSAALAYVNAESPARTRNTQKAAGWNISGTLFDNWAGPVSLAAGLEYRKESSVVTSDALSLQGGYKIGNQQPWSGSYSIKEAYAETVVPLLKDVFLAKSLELNAAARRADYSTSGPVTTWKVGLSYKPIDDLRFRYTRSRDIRAPNLNELFTAGRQGVASVNDPFRTGNPLVSNISTLTTGNPNLQPEKADTTTYGVIYQPSWAQGLSMSVDYYDISIAGAIATVDNQMIVNQCFAGIADLCALITRDAAGNIVRFRNSPVNYSSLKTSGIDIETTYRVPVDQWADWWKGRLTLRGVATYVEHFITAAPGLVTLDTAGSVVGNQPHWRSQVQGTYQLDRLSITLIGQHVGGGLYDATRNARQLGFRESKGQTLLSTQISYDMPQLGGGQVYLNIKNLLDTDPPVAPTAGNLAVNTNGTLYETFGRMIRVGVRFQY